MIRNQQDFVERIGSDKATISQNKNGKIGVPNNIICENSRSLSYDFRGLAHYR
jgi:hypothetical protein